MKAKPKSYEVTVKQFELHVAETVMTVVGAKSRAQAVALGAAHVVGGNLPLPTGVKIVGAMETCTEFDDIEDRAWSPLELPHVKKAVLLA